MVPARAQAPRGHASITGGHTPTRGYPFMAVVRSDKRNQPGYLCGGSLIAARWVLTAGHCVYDPATGTKIPPERVKVVLGQTSIQAFLDNSADPEWRPAATVELNPSYREGEATATHDVALVQLATPVAYAQARLPRPPDVPLWAPGTPATLIGFGKTAADSQISPNLLETEVTVRPDTECRSANGAVDVSVTICAMSGDARGACQGDSGGPLLVSGTDSVLAGVTSFAHTLCGGAINGFARVGSDPLNAFIRDRVPQAEIDLSPAGPQPGDTVTMSSASRNPYGPYTSLRWDLDADGVFDDALGASVSRTLALGQYRVGLEAADGAGNREVRYITIDVRPRTAINIADPRPPARIREGQPVRVSLQPAGSGAGTIAALATRRTARPRRDFDPSGLTSPIAFAAGETVKTLLIPTREDWRRERSERFRITLGNPTGQLTVGPDAVRDVTIVDDDVVRVTSGKTIRVRGGRAGVRLRALRRGRVTVVLERRTSRGVTRLGAKRRRVRPGHTTLRVSLNRAGRRLAVRGGTVYVTLLRGKDPVGPPVRRRLSPRPPRA
jgi:trypsin